MLFQGTIDFDSDLRRVIYFNDQAIFLTKLWSRDRSRDRACDRTNLSEVLRDNVPAHAEPHHDFRRCGVPLFDYIHHSSKFFSVSVSGNKQFLIIYLLKIMFIQIIVGNKKKITLNI